MPTEITSIVGTKYAFKVFMDKFNATKLLPVFNVLRMSADPDTIKSLQEATTPAKVLTIQHKYHIHRLVIYNSILFDDLVVTLIILFEQPDNEDTSQSVPNVVPFVSFVLVNCLLTFQSCVEEYNPSH